MSDADSAQGREASAMRRSPATSTYIRTHRAPRRITPCAYLWPSSLSSPVPWKLVLENTKGNANQAYCCAARRVGAQVAEAEP